MLALFSCSPVRRTSHVVLQLDRVSLLHVSRRCSSRDRRSMSRNPRGPKRSPTPTSATFPDMPPPPVPSSPGPSPSKPLYLCSPFVEAALVKGNFKTIVVLPKYVDIMEWVAVNGASLLATRWPRSSRPSVRLLYQPQRVLRGHLRVLHATCMSYHVGWAKVRVSLSMCIS